MPDNAEGQVSNTQGQPVAAPSTAADAAVQPSTQQTPPENFSEYSADVSLDDVLTVTDPETGREVSASLKELVEAHKRLSALHGVGVDTYVRALQGDQAARQEILRRIAGQPSVAATPQGASPATIPTAESAVPPPSARPPVPEGWEEIKQYVEQKRAQDIRQGIAKLLEDKQFTALAVRPDAVDRVIERLTLMHQNGIQITQPVLMNVIAEMNKVEQEVQERIKSSAGSLGVEEPFRGGSPEIFSKPRPHPFKEKEAWKKDLAERFRAAIMADRASSGM